MSTQTLLCIIDIAFYVSLSTTAGMCQRQPQQQFQQMYLAGEEVTINYGIDLTNMFSERRKDLDRGWKFTCNCPRCKLESSLPNNISKILANINDQMSSEACKPGSSLASYRCFQNTQPDLEDLCTC